MAAAAAAATVGIHQVDGGVGGSEIVTLRITSNPPKVDLSNNLTTRHRLNIEVGLKLHSNETLSPTKGLFPRQISSCDFALSLREYNFVCLFSKPAGLM